MISTGTVGAMPSYAIPARAVEHGKNRTPRNMTRTWGCWPQKRRLKLIEWFTGEICIRGLRIFAVLGLGIVVAACMGAYWLGRYHEVVRYWRKFR